MKQYIAEELREDIKYLIKKVTELINDDKEKVNNKMDIKKKKKNIIKLLDRFDWAAIGVAACGIILFIHLVIKLKG
jgi:hypothetical protein